MKISPNFCKNWSDSRFKGGFGGAFKEEKASK